MFHISYLAKSACYVGAVPLYTVMSSKNEHISQAPQLVDHFWKALTLRIYSRKKLKTDKIHFTGELALKKTLTNSKKWNKEAH